MSMGDNRISMVEIIGEPFHRLRQPSKPVPEFITKLTGLNDAAVAGHIIDDADIAAFISHADLIVAHHAEFDRQFCERAWPVFKAKAWACSQSQIEWGAEGYEGTRLQYIANQSGFFYDGHHATDDCFACLEILARPLPKCGVLALAKLLDAARMATIRIWAIGSPFESKDILKSRGYRWNDGANGKPKSWHIDLPEPKSDAEIAWLCSDIYKRDAKVQTNRITAFDRFSENRP